MRPGLLVFLLGCTDPQGGSPLSPPTGAPDPSPTLSQTVTSPAPEPEPTPPEPEVPGPLQIQFLGVGGYLIRYGEDAILTPPMYTNPDFFSTTLGTIESDPALVEQFSAGFQFDDVRAMLVGHGHYDHLLDAPTLWPKTPDAPIYGNATVAHLLAAFAPTAPPGCEDRPTPPVLIPNDRIIQLDDPDGTLGHDSVDYRLCPEKDPDGGASEGEWIVLDSAPIRFRALCSMHPDQIGPIHFAPGDLTEDQCIPPEKADDWLEGLTLSFLIDFLDPVTGLPVYRVYYQDAPTEVPIGLFDPSLLAEKRVDVALLNVGSYPSVTDHPAATLRLMAPRYTIGGHWEDFFFTQDWPTNPIFGHDLDAYEANATDALGDDPQGEVLADGVASSLRQWVPEPGTTFFFPPEE